MSPHHRFTTALAAALAAVIVCSPVTRADILVLNPTHDSYIRASQGNQGSNNLVLVGDTAVGSDYLRGAFAFDLSDPVLTGATINSVTLTLTIADKKDDTSGSQAVTLDLHELSASFTNGGVTWTSRDGTNNWTNPGGDFGAAVVSLAANAGTVDANTSFDFTSAALTSAGADAVGGSLYLIAKLAEEGSVSRSIFRFGSMATTGDAPALTIDYQPFVSDPNLRQDLAGGDANLHFGTLTGAAPVSATRTLRFINDGPTNPITIESAILNGSGIFTLEGVAVNGTGGQSLPLVLQVGDQIELDVTATFTGYVPSAEATLILDTSDNLQDRQFSASASYPEPGSALAHPAIPGTPASAAYQVRIDGVPVPVNDESYFNFHTAFFSMDEPVMVEVEFSSGVSFSSIHPLRHGIHPKVDGNTISFPMLKPHKLVIKASGALPLAICATPNEVNVPASGDPNVIYFGPGVHEPGLIQPDSGQTVYLASGALVKGRIETRDASGVTIRGRGTLDARGYSVRGNKTNAILFQRCSNVHIEGIGIRGGSYWQTLFLVTNDASATHLSLLGKTVNTDGIDIDGVQRFVARDCFIRCEDDGFGWHALDAQANGEPPTRDCLAEDCVIWNTAAGNGLRVGASMETGLFENITFRNIDVLEHAGAAIYSDHSDWATCRNIRFENFTDETTKQTIDIFIAKTSYSNATGYRDERGHYDGLHFINVNSPGGSIRLRGFDADHLIENVVFRDCYRGTAPIDGAEDIVTNSFVSGVVFETTADPIFAIEGLAFIEPWAGWVALQYTSGYGRAYSIQASPDLGIGNPFGELLQANGAGPSTGVLFFDPGAVLAPRRFYRVGID